MHVVLLQDNLRLKKKNNNNLFCYIAQDCFRSGEFQEPLFFFDVCRKDFCPSSTSILHTDPDGGKLLQLPQSTLSCTQQRWTRDLTLLFSQKSVKPCADTVTALFPAPGHCAQPTCHSGLHKQYIKTSLSSLQC